VQLESENRVYLEQVGKLVAENRVLQQEVDRLRAREQGVTT
jgi:regulator of replication initiation timing